MLCLTWNLSGGTPKKGLCISKTKVKTKLKWKKIKSLLPRLQFGTSVMCWCELFAYRTVQNDTEQWAEMYSLSSWISEWDGWEHTWGHGCVTKYIVFAVQVGWVQPSADGRSIHLALCTLHLVHPKVNTWQWLAQSCLQQSQALQYPCFKLAFSFSLSFLSSPLVFLTRFL